MKRYDEIQEVKKHDSEAKTFEEILKFNPTMTPWVDLHLQTEQPHSQSTRKAPQAKRP